MLYIRKGQEPEEIRQWKQRFKRVSKRFPRYEDIPDKEKEILKNALILEQGNLCCYCCSHILPESSHIEHFRPKRKPQYEKLSLEYTNLHASCQGEKGDMKHCGHAKKNHFDEELLISPLDPDCERRFVFWGNGKIDPAEKDAGAKYTIDILFLNDRRLIKAREPGGPPGIKAPCK